MAKDFAKYVKKLRLKKGCKYILFIPDAAGLDEMNLQYLSDAVLKEGFKGLIVRTVSNRGIKVVEK